jgi:hypothetical protein
MAREQVGLGILGLALVLVGVLVIVPFVMNMFPNFFSEGFFAPKRHSKALASAKALAKRESKTPAGRKVLALCNKKYNMNKTPARWSQCVRTGGKMHRAKLSPKQLAAKKARCRKLGCSGITCSH